jgi:hypothetical protein
MQRHQHRCFRPSLRPVQIAEQRHPIVLREHDVGSRLNREFCHHPGQPIPAMRLRKPHSYIRIQPRAVAQSLWRRRKLLRLGLIGTDAVIAGEPTQSRYQWL